MGRAGAVALAGLFKLCKIGLESDMASWRIQRYGVGSNAAAFKNSMQCTRIHPQLFNQKKLKTRSKKTKHISGKMPLLTNAAADCRSQAVQFSQGHTWLQRLLATQAFNISMAAVNPKRLVANSFVVAKQAHKSSAHNGQCRFISSDTLGRCGFEY